MQIRKILIANRGEIALRIIRTAHRMGIATVAVYSDVDRESLHVRYADEAVAIGDAAPSASYLDQDKIIQAALDTGADAIHPGYGFLSENADFARRVADAGLIFIGPSPHAIEVMGSKLEAKAAVTPLGVPQVPGSDGALIDVDAGRQLASEMGYPILIKASAGGGGKGMRIVTSADEMAEQMARAVSEAQSAFGDGSVFIEKYIGHPRHIEVQVLFDQHGQGIYLHDRECSIQRRHQKVIEEAPATHIPDDVRQRMGEASLNVGRSVDYVGAGTVEFLVDDQHNFYFLEMNTRLQVEHPVTEAITGIDLVEWQIRIAEGHSIPWCQSDIKRSGHAIELRIYAEDPANGFMPDIGRLDRFHLPIREGVRVDSGYESGQTIPIAYDPLIAKLIVHAQTRTDAIRLMKEVIQESQIAGVANTLAFGDFVMSHPTFVEARYTTQFVQEYFAPDQLHTLPHDAHMVAHIAKKIFEHRMRQV